MKKLIVVATLVAATLASCGKSPENSTGSGSVQGGSSSPAVSDRIAKEGDTVAVDYLGKLEDGTVFDTSIKSEAEKTPKFNPNRDYSPLLFTLGKGQMIRGFDKGVLGMKVGEKKTLTLPPEDAYGSGGTEEAVPLKALQDSFTESVPRDKYNDYFDFEVEKATFVEQNRPIPKEGETITAGGISATVLKVGETKIKLKVENRQNPFFGKKLKVGLEGTFEGNGITIVKLDSKKVTVKVDNKNNPFYGKKLVAGLEAGFSGEKFTIKSVDKDTVTLIRSHELSGKTLIFEVELKEIK